MLGWRGGRGDNNDPVRWRAGSSHGGFLHRCARRLGTATRAGLGRGIASVCALHRCLLQGTPRRGSGERLHACPRITVPRCHLPGTRQIRPRRPPAGMELRPVPVAERGQSSIMLRLRVETSGFRGAGYMAVHKLWLLLVWHMLWLVDGAHLHTLLSDTTNLTS